MTAHPSNSSDQGPERTVDAVMDRVGQAQQHFELAAIHFVDCRASFDTTSEGKMSEVRLGVTEQKVSLQNDKLEVSIRFEFAAPSPIADEQDKQVNVSTRLRLEYVVPKDRGSIEMEDANIFGRVNGIYNAWPYLREYIQASLVRLGLPQFELPLLRVGGAVQLAGLVDSPQSDSDPDAPDDGAD